MIVSALGFSCVTSKQIKVEQIYQSVTFLPGQIEQKVATDVKLTIIPVEGKTLNKEFFLASIRDGGSFENEIFRTKTLYYTTAKNSKRFGITLERLFDFIENLEKKGFITENIATQFKINFINYSNGFVSDGIESLKNNEPEYPDTYNPFRVNRTYLSVFKIVVDNTSNNIHHVKLSDIQVLNGFNQLIPLQNSYFENNLEGFSEKLKNIYRLNLPNDLIVTPNQKVIKYFAIPAINTNDSILTVKIVNEKGIIDYPFIIRSKSINFEYQLYSIASNCLSCYRSQKFYIVQTSNNLTSIFGDNFYFKDDDAKNSVNLYGISLSNNSIEFGKVVNFNIPRFQNKPINLGYTYSESVEN